MGRTTTASSGPAPSRSVTRVIAEIERMIATGELLPGQPIRQEWMAERLGVSRLPIREALRELTAQGLVGHQHNAGYTVVRLDQGEFDQIYLMRSALEREVLTRLPRFDAAALDEVRAIAVRITEAADHGDIVSMRTENQSFHFAMFERSGLHLVVAELRRLWKLAMPYHAAYLYDPAGRQRVCGEHDAMIDALAEGDNTRLVELMDEHRRGGEANTGMILGGGRP
ncbi:MULTISPECIES: GntR family transcriptional regulator [Gordonia]|jgi:DNA-binding GntR family transcriptional regulator|uniref:GntR family transcriptional regulator n=1 Tax=Gordonia alkanivorans CGMCC 6845 TaxID=1423140 RepID=W9D918_9ACTN|nr:MULTISPECIES: GntR family transcriptional regulator [Gordonia]ETA05803.1 GntR family transcriptional regulator [Gordonia alkanivorans CGMCC 6845]MDH3005817.1 GntR family transcriptional regulator [Gordonia alkanivorans]MDH3011189.1 GntR family transcriptional regulator [Gordonia alkanivorans]MDH3016110.1 GntR family transcriptional regulator [Gordonia alkanivorans]MDH3019772.1 GntR family transcriptional regulator [Gordonia alkanivorans]